MSQVQVPELPLKHTEVGKQLFKSETSVVWLLFMWNKSFKKETTGWKSHFVENSEHNYNMFYKAYGRSIVQLWNSWLFRFVVLLWHLVKIYDTLFEVCATHIDKQGNVSLQHVWEGSNYDRIFSPSPFPKHGSNSRFTIPVISHPKIFRQGFSL